MNSHLINFEKYKFEGLDRFLSNLEVRKCIYYASDFLTDTNEDKAVEVSVLHTIEVFKTLDLATEEHFYQVFRCTPDSIVYKDWKISELACLYTFVNGDRRDLKSVAL